ncbi:MAG TPA: hypothetical protein IAC14_08805 [Candidatus Scybalomonas excrementigallinarum]|nr:hypothetical protein [Candidatus Scybalomonas excrementigallinarum]
MKFKEEIYESMKKDYLKMSEELKRLKRELDLERLKNDFLMKRENKLQMIEHYVNSKSETNLDRLIRMIKGDK